MKTKFLFAATLVLGLQMQAQQLSKPKEIVLKDSFTNPVPSPNGRYVLLTKENNLGVYLLELQTNKITLISPKKGIGYGYSWKPDSKAFYFKEKEEADYFSNAKAMEYNISRKKSKTLAINHNFLPSYNGKNEIVVHTNPTTLKIEATDVKTLKTWVITNEEGQYYNAILSNNGKKVAVHKGADIYIYETNGSTKGKYIGKGIATSWTSDDKHLIGFLDESKDGHSISNSELLAFDVENYKTVKLTSTENQIEMFPSFYGTNQLIFSDEKTGKLYISTLKL